MSLSKREFRQDEVSQDALNGRAPCPTCGSLVAALQNRLHVLKMLIDGHFVVASENTGKSMWAIDNELKEIEKHLRGEI